MKSSRLTAALLLLFVLSGAAGLIYQSIWSHYLGLVLGHAAYAQALVLAIFMGGMALGAWLASRYTARLGHLVLAYAITEAIIGVVGLVFHPVFLAYTDMSQTSVLPALSSPVLAHGYQWLTSALLILPQCVLLGATFPLLSAGLIRVGAESQGKTLGGLYFTNSVGAAAGALITTFVLLPAIGMPGALLTAGLLNIIVALIAWAVWKVLPRVQNAADDTEWAPQAVLEAEDVRDAEKLTGLLLVAAFITGATSFVYEIGWVRMLNQALGASIHSFELMLAAFILGLALGGLWIRFRANSIRNVLEYAGYAQILMGIAALLSLLAFGKSFTWVEWIMRALSRTDQGYTLYVVASAVVSLIVMLPAAFFAGMTLPLFTTALLQGRSGEKAIGQIYAANTLGAIGGVCVMMFLLVPLAGVRLSVAFAALADALLGFYIILVAVPATRKVPVMAAAMATMIAAFLGLIYGKPDPRQQVSGVFRTGSSSMNDRTEINYLVDGRTATISVGTEPNGNVFIATNGKPDAAMLLDMSGEVTGDEPTMIMAGSLPMLLHAKPEAIAVIGWGSGLTTHTLAGHPTPKVIETIEIEPAMVEGAKLFGARTERAYSDPRSIIHIDDARTYFSSSNKRYDAIISEPSNPWVSGVASLFTTEFYSFIKKHLNDRGMLIQWLHAYEISDALQATMMAALLEQFPETHLYMSNSMDMMFVAGADDFVHAPNYAALQVEPIHGELKRVSLGSAQEFSLRKVAGPDVLRTHLLLQSATPHSDFYPTVSLIAPRTRFRGDRALQLLSLVDNGLPVLDVLDGREVPASNMVKSAPESRFSLAALDAVEIKEKILRKDPALVKLQSGDEYASYVAGMLSSSSREITDVHYWSDMVANVTDGTLGLLPANEQEGLWVNPVWIDLQQQPESVKALMSLYAATAVRDVPQMHAQGAALLKAPYFSQYSDYAREQVLIIAQLGAIGSGNPSEAIAMDRLYGKNVPVSQRFGYVRQFLLAWSDRVIEESENSSRAALR